MTAQGYIDPDYVDVAERIRLFYERFPDGSLQTIEHGVHDVGSAIFVICKVAAYKTPDDPKPCHGIAWEPFPGPTPFTRNSELMNAQTSAWGRAIIAAGIPSKKVASAEEVQARKVPEAEASVEMVSKGQHAAIGALVKEIATATEQTTDKVAQDSRVWISELFGKVTRADLTHDEASKLIEHLKALKEAAEVPFG